MRADTRLTNDAILTKDNGFRVITDGCVTIREGTIGHIGAMPADISAHSIVDARGGLIMPGFINTHCHVARLASGIAPVRVLMDARVTLSLGTDGPSIGNDLGMLKAMRLTACLHARRIGSPETLSARDIVAVSTVGGARALGLSARQGSLEVGKRADVVALRSDAPHDPDLRPLPRARLLRRAGRCGACRRPRPACRPRWQAGYASGRSGR